MLLEVARNAKRLQVVEAVRSAFFQGDYVIGLNVSRAAAGMAALDAAVPVPLLGADREPPIPAEAFGGRHLGILNYLLN